MNEPGAVFTFYRRLCSCLHIVYLYCKVNPALMPSSYWQTSKSEVDFYLTHARRPLPKNKASRFRGVQKNGNPKKPFRVALVFNGRRFMGGIYDDEIEAAKAYNALALKVIGPKAILNDIPDRKTNQEDSGGHSVCTVHGQPGNSTQTNQQALDYPR